MNEPQKNDKIAQLKDCSIYSNNHLCYTDCNGWTSAVAIYHDDIITKLSLNGKQHIAIPAKSPERKQAEQSPINKIHEDDHNRSYAIEIINESNPSLGRRHALKDQHQAKLISIIQEPRSRQT